MKKCFDVCGYGTGVSCSLPAGDCPYVCPYSSLKSECPHIENVGDCKMCPAWFDNRPCKENAPSVLEH